MVVMARVRTRLPVMTKDTLQARGGYLRKDFEKRNAGPIRTGMDPAFPGCGCDCETSGPLRGAPSAGSRLGPRARARAAASPSEPRWDNRGSDLTRIAADKSACRAARVNRASNRTIA